MGCTSSNTASRKSSNPTRASSVYFATSNGKKFDDTPPKVDDEGHLAAEEVRKRITASKSVCRITVGEEEKTEIQYAYLTQQGYDADTPGKPNQDAHSITLKFGGEETDAMFAVFDGHGASGHECSSFAKTDIPRSVAKYIRQRRSQDYISRLKAEGKSTKAAFKPELWPDLDVERYEECCRKAFDETNRALHHDKAIDDKLSGTTAVTVSFHKGRMTVCNVGDSRVILGKFNEGEMLPIPLSKDQTPYREDERKRVVGEGADIKSILQMKGQEEMHDDWGDMVYGKFVETNRDPPRLWVNGNEFPGTAFTRSLGDTVAENIGVTAEPEIVTRSLTETDKYLVIASDGLFDFLTNQNVISIVSDSNDPVEACESLREAAYSQWVKHENRVDDITVIVCFLENSTGAETNTDGTTEDLVSEVGSFYGTPSKSKDGDERSLPAKSDDGEEKENDLSCGIDL